MSNPPQPLDPFAVTLLEPFDLVPVIRGILHTQYCPPRAILLVEGLDAVSVSKSGRWQAVRLLLGDGVLCVQALLGGSMHRLVHTGDIALGAYIRCEMYEIRRRGMMVYLVVDDCVTVGWNESYRALPPRRALVVPRIIVTKPEEDEDAEEALGDFETLAFPRKANRPEKTQDLHTSKSLPIALARDWHDPQAPLKLTTLRSIPHLPYKQNWSCNVLAIVVSLSPVEVSNLPPYTQRTARIADPSTSKQVHLTVFLDPEDFAPKVGSAVLLVGVKNHRFDGGSLKKYASDGSQGRWWFEEPRDLGWCDVGGIKEWWAEMAKATQDDDG